MFHIARRPVAALTLFLVLAPTLAGCRSVERVPFNSTSPMDQTVGITMRSGQKIAFDPKGASVRNDTLYGVSRKGQVMVPVPVDSIAEVWRSKVSAGRTVGLVLGMAAGLYVIAAIAGAKAFGSSKLY